MSKLYWIEVFVVRDNVNVMMDTEASIIVNLIFIFFFSPIHILPFFYSIALALICARIFFFLDKSNLFIEKN